MLRSMFAVTVALVAASFTASSFAMADDEPAKGPEEQAEGRRGRPNPEQMFKRLDKNNDGKITLDEVPEERKGFWEKVIANADKDNDQAATKEELRAGFEKWQKERGERGPRGGGPRERGPRDGGPRGGGPNPERMFGHMDKNSDGKVTLDEVPEERRQRVERLIKRADKDGDKALSRDEFIGGMKEAAERWKERAEARGGDDEDRPRRRGGPGRGEGRGDDDRDRPRGEGRGDRGSRDRDHKDDDHAEHRGHDDRRGDHGGDHGPRHKPNPERMAKHMFKQLDTSGDGKLTEDEVVAGAKKRFERLDADKNGSVDEAEVKEHMHEMRGKRHEHQGDKGKRHQKENEDDHGDRDDD